MVSFRSATIVLAFVLLYDPSQNNFCVCGTRERLEVQFLLYIYSVVVPLIEKAFLSFALYIALIIFQNLIDHRYGSISELPILFH